jgi:hypothetical protein
MRGRRSVTSTMNESAPVYSFLVSILDLLFCLIVPKTPTWYPSQLEHTYFSVPWLRSKYSRGWGGCSWTPEMPCAVTGDDDLLCQCGSSASSAPDGGVSLYAVFSSRGECCRCSSISIAPQSATFGRIDTNLLIKGGNVGVVNGRGSMARGSNGTMTVPEFPMSQEAGPADCLSAPLQFRNRALTRTHSPETQLCE